MTQQGLILFGTRYYDAALGVWTQPDPAADSLARSPTQSDAYSFAGGDPINAVDRTGEKGKLSRRVKEALAVAGALHALGGAVEVAGEIAGSPEVERIAQVLNGAAEAVQKVADAEREGEEHPGGTTGPSGSDGGVMSPMFGSFMSAAKSQVVWLAGAGAAVGGAIGSAVSGLAGDAEGVLGAFA
jgi:RHS repeat-associated protein